MVCERCHGLALYEMAYDHGGGMVSGQYACLNCSARVYVGPLMPRTPFTLRKIEKLGRWQHKQ